MEFLSNNCLKLDLPLNSTKTPKNILLLGNLKGLFGEFSLKGQMLANLNDQNSCYNYQWLRKEIKAGSTITILSDKDTISYFQRIYECLFWDIPEYKNELKRLKPVTINKYFKKRPKEKFSYSVFLKEYVNSSKKYDTILVVPTLDKTPGGEELKAIENAIPLLSNSDAICYCIMPYNWLIDPYKNLKTSSHYKAHLDLTHHIESIKTGIFYRSLYENSFLGIYKIRKNPKYNFSVLSNVEKNVLDKVAKFTMSSPIPVGKNLLLDSDGWEVHWSGMETFNPYILGSEKLGSLEYSYNCPKKISMEVGFTSELECINFCKTFSCKLIRFFTHFSLRENKGLSISSRVAPWMGNSVNLRTGLMGYESEWTDNDFYDFFKLTQEEIDYVEDFVDNWFEKYK